MHPTHEKPNIQKDKFYYEMVYEWDMKGTKDLTLGIGDFHGHVGKKVNGFGGYMREMKLGAKFGR